MSYYYGYGPMGYGGGFGFLFMVLAWILFVVIIVGIVRWIVWGSMHRHGIYHHHDGLMNDSEPNNILKQRYAKGEITKEQFEQMKKDLE